MPERRGTFLVLDGIDGAGKSTQLRILADLLRRAGAEVVTSKEPTTGPWGMKIRASAQDGRMALEDELQAFIEDRREHVRDLIEPALARGAVVILDRYYPSTIAYQGARGGDVPRMRALMREFPVPDLTLIFDLDPEVGVGRVAARDGAPDHFEDRDELARVRAIFHSLLDERTVRIDGGGTIEAVTADVLARVVGAGAPLAHLRDAVHAALAEAPPRP